MSRPKSVGGCFFFYDTTLLDLGLGQTFHQLRLLCYHTVETTYNRHIIMSFLCLEDLHLAEKNDFAGLQSANARGWLPVVGLSRHELDLLIMILRRQRLWLWRME